MLICVGRFPPVKVVISLFSFSKILLQLHTQKLTQMHQHIPNVFLKLLLGKKCLPSRGLQAPHASFLQRRLNQIRLQAPFIVPHRKSSNFLKNGHSHDRTVYANMTQTLSKVHQPMEIKLSSLASKPVQKPDTQNTKELTHLISPPCGLLEETITTECSIPKVEMLQICAKGVKL